MIAARVLLALLLPAGANAQAMPHSKPRPRRHQRQAHRQQRHLAAPRILDTGAALVARRAWSLNLSAELSALYDRPDATIYPRIHQSEHDPALAWTHLRYDMLGPIGPICRASSRPPNTPPHPAQSARTPKVHNGALTPRSVSPRSGATGALRPGRRREARVRAERAAGAVRRHLDWLQRRVGVRGGHREADALHGAHLRLHRARLRRAAARATSTRHPAPAVHRCDRPLRRRRQLT